MRRACLIMIACLGAACGSDPGTGTGTLFVDAVARTDGSTQGTSLTVLIRQGSSSGELISDAVVEVTGDRGSVHVLPYSGFSFAGSYNKSDIAWEPGWRLHIQRGADELEAYLQAPGTTTITRPDPGEVFNRALGEPLRVEWSDDAGRRAEVVEVRLQQGAYERASTEDPGHREIPPGTWSEATQETVFVERINDLPLEGGASGSLFKAISEATLTFSVQ